MGKDLLYAMYMGGPDSLEAIEPFLFNLFSDRTIIDFKIGDRLQRFAASKIAKSRAKKVAPEYIKMGGASPQLKHMSALLDKVQDIYTEKTGRQLDAVKGMCYYHPYIEETLPLCAGEEYDNIYVITMYPQFSYTTSGVCFRRFHEQELKTPLHGNVKIVKDWYDDENYNQCLIDRIRTACTRLGKDVSDCTVLFSAHGLPEYTVKRGDAYVPQIKEQVEYITSKLGAKESILAYQSRTGPVKWLRPYTDEVIKKLASQGADGVVVVPISFVSDHIETLIELDEQYIADAKKTGLNIIRIESLNASNDFAQAFTDIILKERG